MTEFSLSDRIAFHLAEEGRPETADEIARALHARTADVRAVLESDRRFARTLPGRRSPKAKLYVVLAPTDPQDGSGQPSTERTAA